ncbi:ankyrin repeat [Stylonychia lemnae]|uniref:Ankyrin repeat n=1 Tax=Stylonychia lemnae TaxID=5949 RepID=A0A078AYU8_STYLE|nr:ankyrin repeat [Stylonychia lemnae]|eukprot:CDW87339.1 ankyrin repeat [Stylonychia lemnae]
MGNNQVTEPPQQILQEAAQNFQEQLQIDREQEEKKWRDQLKVSDMVDANLDIYNTDQFCWGQAQIIKTDGIILELQFLYELNIPKIISAEFQAGSPYKAAKIGFRIYCENGIERDHLGKFNGQPESADKYITLYSTRIKPLGSQTLKPFKVIYAASFGTLSQLKQLIERDGYLINELSNYKETPIFMACYHGRQEIVEYLIEKKAFINIKTNYYLTPIQAAMITGREKIVKLLLENRAQPSLECQCYYTKQLLDNLKPEVTQVIFEHHEWKIVKQDLVAIDKILKEKPANQFQKINQNIMRKIINEYI